MAVPEMMLGSFQMETSEGFDEFMYELGVNMFTRLVVGMEDQNAYVCICWVFWLNEFMYELGVNMLTRFADQNTQDFV